ncbi:MAG: prenyltransferase/squalene oxidase repeat-containing protein [Planctomycetota bacterium]|jgi:hypothetical protein|nr:prenyltransferase/squalene oxidase repeat-containing protein [Planctomycetota bacterium]
MKQSCKHIQDESLNYQFGLCDDSDQARIENHLQTCGACRAEFERDEDFGPLLKTAALVDIPPIHFAPRAIPVADSIFHCIPGVAMLLNPRSPLHKYVQNARLVAVLIVSIALLLLVGTFLLNFELGSVRRGSITDYSIVTTVEEEFIDQEQLDRIFDELETDVEQVAMEPVAVVLDADLPPMDVPDVGPELQGAIEQDQPGEEEFQDAMDAVRDLALGERGSRVIAVSNDDFSSISSYRIRLDPRLRTKQGLMRGASRQTENAVLGGLKFLARTQRGDGSWSSNAEAVERGNTEVRGDHDTAITGLALLSFLGAGHSEATGKYRPAVSKAVNYLRRTQAENGSWLNGGRMYGHGICAMAMSEAYGMAGAKSSAAQSAQLGINFIVQSQGEGGGFGYGGPGEDTSVTGWQIMACKSGKVAGLKVPEEAIDGFVRFLNSKVDPETGRTGYRSPGKGSNAMVAVGLVCRLFLGQQPGKNPVLAKAAEVLNKAGPNPRDCYYDYYATLGMFQMGKGHWKEWNERFSLALVARQSRLGSFAGSWDYKGITHADRGGRIYVTAMNVLSLEVYYRYLPMYR